MNKKIILPAMAAVLMLSAAAVAQTQQGPRGNRAAPTAEQMQTRRADMCNAQYARAVGNAAALETRLNLTAAQKPLFDKYKTAILGQAKTRTDACAKPPARAANANGTPPARPGLVERRTRQEQMLKDQLANLQATTPSLTALYNALTPEQKQIMDRGERGARMGMIGGRGQGKGQRMGMMGRGAGPDAGPGGRGRGGPGMMGPGGPQNGNPPPKQGA